VTFVLETCLNGEVMSTFVFRVAAIPHLDYHWQCLMSCTYTIYYLWLL